MDRPQDNERYSRQTRFAPIGTEGQARLMRSTAVVVGCGALGSHQAQMLVRAGVGTVRLIDRDELELSNLQRQVLFTPQDLDEGLPKAEAAARHLRQINPDVRVEARVADLDPANINDLLQTADVVLDAVDNFQTRLLVNEWCVREDVPLIHGGVVGSEGNVLGVHPGHTPCLECISGEESGTLTCDHVGIIAPAVAVVAGVQVAEAMKVLVGRAHLLTGTLWRIDLWRGQMRTFDLSAARDSDCPVCAHRHFARLAGSRHRGTEVLCGGDTVQVWPPEGAGPPDLQGLGERLAPLGDVRRNPHLLHAAIGGYRFTIFADGRALVRGTNDPALARSLYARYIGN